MLDSGACYVVSFTSFRPDGRIYILRMATTFREFHRRTKRSLRPLNLNGHTRALPMARIPFQRTEVMFQQLFVTEQKSQQLGLFFTRFRVVLSHFPFTTEPGG